MKRTKSSLAIPIFCLALAVASCANPPANRQQGQARDGNTAGTRSNDNPSATPPVNVRNLHDPAIIPSPFGPKTRSTNEYGRTYSGMGHDLYSTMGSSGVHTGGISTNLESVLRSTGADGVHVLVLDDTVILGQTNKHHTDGSRYDPMQSKVLSRYSGTSATDPRNETGYTGTYGTSGAPLAGGRSGGMSDGAGIRDTTGGGAGAVGTGGNAGGRSSAGGGNTSGAGGGNPSGAGGGNTSGAASRPNAGGAASGAGAAANTAGGDSMTMAVQEIQRMFGSDVRVLTVHDPRAVQAINRVKSNMKSARSQANVTSDLALIMKHATEARNSYNQSR